MRRPIHILIYSPFSVKEVMRIFYVVYSPANSPVDKFDIFGNPDKIWDKLIFGLID